MFSLQIPTFDTPRRIAGAACFIALVGAVTQLVTSQASIGLSLGDTDDALRLVMVRELIGGKSWFDAHIDRLQPPYGLDMQWSRLIDGGLAALYRLFALIVPPAEAEVAMRFTWPLLWIVPTVVAALVIARRLGGNVAVFVCAVLLVNYRSAYVQFQPGRIDHHNAQIALTLVAVAGLIVLDSSRWGARVAGFATGLALAVGLEGLVFAIAIASIIAVRVIREPSLAAAARQYALALWLTTTVTYVAQTPPERLLLSTCDSLGFNLVLAVSAGTAGLSGAAMMVERGGLVTTLRRAAAVGTVAAIAVALYGALDPRCLKGPFGATEPSLWPVWLDHVAEVRSLGQILAEQGEVALSLVVGPVMGVAAFAITLRDQFHRRDPAWIAAGVLLALATLYMVQMVRAAPYAMWIGAPVIAGAVAASLARHGRNLLVPALAGAVLASPAVLTSVAQQLARMPTVVGREAVGSGEAAGNGEQCFDKASYMPLASEQPGLVLNDIDLGPFNLAHTPHSTMSGPYHRMHYGIGTAHRVLTAPPDEGRRTVETLGIDYVALCPALASGKGPYADSPPGHLRQRLAAGDTPFWLERLPGERIHVYRVRRGEKI